MLGMDTWDIALLCVAAYVAIITLVRLMRRHRDVLLERLHSDLEQEHHRLKKERRRQNRKEMLQKAQEERAA